MGELSLTLACDQNDRNQPLLDGSVRAEGIDLNVLSLPVEETFWRTLRHQEFDAAELSMSSYLMTLERDTPDLIAIPAFPSRFFRHSAIYVNTDAGIDEPSDLRGRRVGVPEYQITAALWIRGMLRDEHGVDPADVQWFQGGEEEGGREEKLELSLPGDIAIETIPSDQTLSRMLGSGDLDALVTARAPSTYGTPTVERLFPNYREVEREYYERTGHFPIMHTVVLRGAVYDEAPWVAQELLKAFTVAKDRSLERLHDTGELQVALPWLIDAVEETRELMGGDYWPYGVEANRDTLETMTRYSHEQGLTDERLSVDELFAPTTYDEYAV